MVETYYDLLGVDPDASHDEIRTAYRERLKETHPDVSNRPDAGRLTQRLIDAKDVLTDEVERERYDRLGHEAFLASTAGSTTDQTVENATERTREDTSVDGDAATATDQRGRATGPSDPRGEAARPGGDAETTADDPVDGVSWQDTQRAQRFGRAGGVYGTASGSEWRAWDSDRSYSIGGERGGGFLAGRRVPDTRTLVTLLVILIVYPILVWGTVLPAFPLAVNLLMGVLTVVLIAFLQSLPTAAVAIFGFWTVMMPVVLATGFGVSLTSLIGLAMVLGMALPLGFSILTRSIVRY